MDSSSNLYFPDAATLTKCICNHPLFKMEYYLQEKGITKAISELAAARFANTKKVDEGIKLGAMLLIYDLHEGEDGFTGKPLPNLGKLGLHSVFWEQMALSTEKALKDCANSAKVNSKP